MPQVGVKDGRITGRDEKRECGSGEGGGLGGEEGGREGGRGGGGRAMLFFFLNSNSYYK